MRKKIMIILAAAFFLTAVAVPVSAQQVLMNSAETINKGNLKLAIFPTVLFGKNGGDSVFGVAGRFGYGFTREPGHRGQGRVLQGAQILRGRCRVLVRQRA